MVSRRASFDGTHPIRGGIPVVFPQFCDGKSHGGVSGALALPWHGLARTEEWALLRAGDGTLTLELADTPATREVYNASFRLTMTITFDGTRLEQVVRGENTGAAAFEFQALLHTYFACPAVEGVAVRGLRGVTLIDKLRAYEESVEEHDTVTIQHETDRIYRAAPRVVFVDGVGVGGARGPGTVRLSRAAHLDGSPMDMDIVIWNPWVRGEGPAATLLTRH